MEFIDFAQKFDEILASLNRPMTKEYKKVWFEKMRSQKWEVFEKAVDEVVMSGGKYLPTIPQLLAVCHRVKSGMAGVDDKGCEWCIRGWVLYEPRPGRGGGQGVAVRCSHCNPKPGEKDYDAKRNKRGLLLSYTPGGEKETHVAGVVPAFVGCKVETAQSESEKAKARIISLQEERGRLAKDNDFPYENTEDVPF